MTLYDPLCHTATVEVTVPAETAFKFLSDPIELGRWALGCMDSKATDQEDIYKGTSIFDGTECWFRIEADRKRFSIDYHVGEPENLVPRVFTRVIPGLSCARIAGHCLISMIAWRPGNMSKPRWQRLCTTHDAEILIIKAKLENQG